MESGTAGFPDGTTCRARRTGGWSTLRCAVAVRLGGSCGALKRTKQEVLQGGGGGFGGGGAKASAVSRSQSPFNYPKTGRSRQWDS